MEILRQVSRQEEELLERGKLTKSLTTPPAPRPKRKGEESDKEFNTKYEKRGSDNKTGKGQSRWKAPRNNTAKNKNNTVQKDEHTDWKKAHNGIKNDVVEKRKKEKRGTRCSMGNNTWKKCGKPILVDATFAYKNRGNPKQPFKPRTSTLAVHQPPPARQEPAAKVNLIRRERPRKSGNYPIQKCHRCTRRKISKYFLSSVYKSLFISLSGQTRADVTMSLRMTGTRASRVLDSRSKQIPLILKAAECDYKDFFTHVTPRHVLEILGKVLALVQKFSQQNAGIPHLLEPSNME